MKAAAYLLLIALAVLMVQPAFTNFNGKAAGSTCTSKRSAKSGCAMKKAKVIPGCTKKKCDRSGSSKGKNPCGADACNPLLGCPSGNFYLLLYSYISIDPLIIAKQRTELVNDNRISKQLTECFHPPEII